MKSGYQTEGDDNRGHIYSVEIPDLDNLPIETTPMLVMFDHIEVHVVDIPAYCQFLSDLFIGGRFKQISDSGTSMYVTPDGMNIEVKARKLSTAPADSGVCRPCIRMADAKNHIEHTLGLVITETLENPEGQVYFFHDREGILWHVKDYAHRDQFINW